MLVFQREPNTAVVLAFFLAIYTVAAHRPLAASSAGGVLALLSFVALMLAVLLAFCLIAASGHRDITVKLWDAATGAPRKTLAGHRGRTDGVAFSPDGQTLATSGGDGSTRIWELATFKATRTYRLHSPRGEISHHV